MVQLRVSHEVGIKMLARAGVIWGWTGFEGFLSRKLTPRVGKLVLVFGRRPQFLPTWTSLQGCLGCPQHGGWLPPPENDPRARGRSHMSCKPWSQNHLSSPLPYSVRRESLTQGENLESTFWRYVIKEFAHCKKTHHNYLDTFKSKLSKLNGMFQRYFTMNYTLFYTHCLLVYNALLCLILQLFF